MVRCPQCDTDMDLDENEIEEGEILTCPECDAEMEVVQLNPIHLNVISEDDEEDEEEDLKDGDEAENEEDEDEEDLAE